jgi:hypothetical protein
MDQDNQSPDSNDGQGTLKRKPNLVDENDVDFLLPGHREERRGSRPGVMRVRIVLPLALLGYIPIPTFCSYCPQTPILKRVG